MMLIEDRGLGRCDVTDIRGMREFADVVTAEIPRVRAEIKQLAVPDAAMQRAVNERRERIRDELGRRRSQRMAQLDEDERSRGAQQRAADDAHDLAVEKEEAFATARGALEHYAQTLGLEAHQRAEHSAT